MTRLTDTRVEVQDDSNTRVVAFETDAGSVEFIGMGDEPSVEVDFEPVSVTEAAEILGDVADDLGTEAVQVACDILSDIDEDAMFEAFENESDETIVATADGVQIIDGTDATTDGGSLSDDAWDAVQEDLRENIDLMRDVYADEANNNEIVEETDEYLLLRDGSGHELNEIAEIVGVDRSALSRRMHDEARRRHHSDEPGDEWSVTDPVVIVKGEA